MTGFNFSFLFDSVLCLIVAYQISTCHGTDCQFSNDVDLHTATSLMGRLDNLRTQNFDTSSQVDGKKLMFYFQLCGNPIIPNESCKELRSSNGSVVEVDENSCAIIGNYNETTINGGVDWVSVSYRGSLVNNMSGENSIFRDTVVTFVCDPNFKQETFTLAHINHCMNTRLHYTFVITSSQACTKTGLSGGSVFCILFFTFLGAYFFFGFLYRRVIVRAKGFEQIPNYESWKEFGSLIADGCDFICRCNNRQSNKLYQGIDDSFSHPNDSGEGGDDHLLPM